MPVQNDPWLALSLLTRLPIRLKDEDFARSAQAAWAYPIVGVVTGALSAALGLAALALGLPAPIAALLCLATSMSVTGAMHEDGLADCADGFWGGWDPAMRLKIMKDSQIGTYGVLALLVTVGLRWSALTVLLTSGPCGLDDLRCACGLACCDAWNYGGSAACARDGPVCSSGPRLMEKRRNRRCDRLCGLRAVLWRDERRRDHHNPHGRDFRGEPNSPKKDRRTKLGMS